MNSYYPHRLTTNTALDPDRAGMFSPVVAVMHVPIALHEVVMAVWLTVKGFNASTSAAKDACLADMNSKSRNPPNGSAAK